MPKIIRKFDGSVKRITGLLKRPLHYARRLTRCEIAVELLSRSGGHMQVVSKLRLGPRAGGGRPASRLRAAGEALKRELAAPPSNSALAPAECRPEALSWRVRC